jgi:hypothetical protein
MSIPKNGRKFTLTVRILPLQEWYKVWTAIAVGTGDGRRHRNTCTDNSRRHNPGLAVGTGQSSAVGTASPL